MVNSMNIITSRNMYVFLSFLPNSVGKAYVTHIFSSGMSKQEALSLDINSLIHACDAAFRKTEERTLENLLVKDPVFITPMWQIDTTHGKKITFSSSESLFYMFIYLKERLLKEKRIDLDEKLFVTGNGVLSSPELVKIFKHSEKCCFNDKDFTYRVLFSKSAPNNYYSRSHFTTKDLTKNFETICDKYLPLFTDNEEEIREYANKGTHNIKRRKLQKLFCKGLPEEDEYYKEFVKDVSCLEKYYSMLLPYLTAKNYEQIIQIFKSAEDKYLWDKMHEKALKDYKNQFSDEELTQELDGYLKYGYDNELNNELISIFKDLAIEENNYGHFKNTKEHLDKLMGDAIIMEFVLNLDFKTRYINKKLSKQMLIEELDELGVFKKFNINTENFLLSLEDYMDFLEKHGKKRNLSKEALAQVLISSRL